MGQEDNNKNQSQHRGMKSSTAEIWSAAQEVLRSILNQEIYSLWFSPIRAVNLDDDCITLEVANDFCEVWLKDNYLGLIQDVLSQSSGRHLKVKFQVADTDDADTASLKKSEASQSSGNVSGETTVSYFTQPFNNGPVQTAAKSAPPAPTLSSGPIHSAQPSRSREGSTISGDLNAHYTFNSFVVGANNNYAHAAALAVAQAPGKVYNPLFIYGGVGLGKTHLLHAIGHHIISSKRGAKVAYISSEKFTNEFIDAIQNNTLIQFRKKYRMTDALLIDDIQFLSSKERIQEEFFHTFNALHESHKQIVMTCDRPANEIQNLAQRLVSRFEWGVVADLQTPDVETRLAILRKKEEMLGVKLPEEVIEFLANRIRTNVRRLEGALIRMVSFASLTGRRLTIETVEEALREVIQEEESYTITVDLIQKLTADHFAINLADMKSKRRPENIAFARQVAMYLSRELTELSLNSIGEAFGGRDHGTVLHAYRIVKDRIEVDANVRQSVSYLRKQLTR